MLGLFVYFVSFALKVPRGKRHLQLFQVCPIISQVEIRLGKIFSLQPGLCLHLKERHAKKGSQKTADKIEKIPVRRTNYALIIYIRFQQEQNKIFICMTITFLTELQKRINFQF